MKRVEEDKKRALEDMREKSREVQEKVCEQITLSSQIAFFGCSFALSFFPVSLGR